MLWVCVRWQRKEEALLGWYEVQLELDVALEALWGDGVDVGLGSFAEFETRRHRTMGQREHLIDEDVDRLVWLYARRELEVENRCMVVGSW